MGNLKTYRRTRNIKVIGILRRTLIPIFDCKDRKWDGDVTVGRYRYKGVPRLEEAPRILKEIE